MQWAIIRLSRLLNHEEITMSLDLSTRTVRRVISHFHAHGTISNADENSTQREHKDNRNLRVVY
ncbi:hypothetical protein V8B97DRAFT_1941824 [Scleroderma yunnanense]